MIKLRNLILFTLFAIRRRTPLRLWRRAWYDVQEEHLAQVRKIDSYAWPAANDIDAWRKAYELAVSHAKKKTNESEPPK